MFWLYLLWRASVFFLIQFKCFIFQVFNMLIVCEDCGHEEEVDVIKKIRMDIDDYIGEMPRCHECESEKVLLV